MGPPIKEERVDQNEKMPWAGIRVNSPIILNV